MTSPPPEWLTATPAARYAGVTRDAIYTAWEHGELAVRVHQGRRLTRVTWLDGWLERRRNTEPVLVAKDFETEFGCCRVTALRRMREIPGCRTGQRGRLEVPKSAWDAHCADDVAEAEPARAS
jgi:hypothetical protein